MFDQGGYFIVNGS
jgi:DNA-directed RNA polymerase II subunit RPB2